jgi:hypothetical protein
VLIQINLLKNENPTKPAIDSPYCANLPIATGEGKLEERRPWVI